MIASTPELDPELEALLREEGIDPARVLARQAEMAKWKRSPEEEAKLAAEIEELREATESFNEHLARNGSLADHARAAERSRS